MRRGLCIVDAILDVPITEEQKAEILAGAVAALDEDCRTLCERFVAAGAKDTHWEKVDASTWRFVRHLGDNDSPLQETIWSGPHIKERPEDRRYPFAAVFEGRGRRITVPEAQWTSTVIIFRYDKLAGKWAKL